MQNTGAAFGIFAQNHNFLTMISFIAIIMLSYFRKQHFDANMWQRASFIFLFSGIFGNLLDRFFLGYVIDFFALPNFPVFNFADIFINIGVGLLIIDYLIQRKK